MGACLPSQAAQQLGEHSRLAWVSGRQGQRGGTSSHGPGRVARMCGIWLRVLCLFPSFQGYSITCSWMFVGGMLLRKRNARRAPEGTYLCDFWKLLAPGVLVCWVQVFVTLAWRLVGFGSLICPLSPAVQAPKLIKLGFTIIVDMSRGGRGAAGKGGKAGAAAGLLNGTLCLPCPDGRA